MSGQCLVQLSILEMFIKIIFFTPVTADHDIIWYETWMFGSFEENTIQDWCITRPHGGLKLRGTTNLGLEMQSIANCMQCCCRLLRILRLCCRFNWSTESLMNTEHCSQLMMNADDDTVISPGHWSLVRSVSDIAPVWQLSRYCAQSHSALLYWCCTLHGRPAQPQHRENMLIKIQNNNSDDIL